MNNNLEYLIELTEKFILQKTGNSLSFIQKVILKECLNETRKNYGKIALENNYSEKYIRQLVAPKLWRLLSLAIGEKVTRNNCLVVLQKLDLLNSVQELQSNAKPDYLNQENPQGYVPVNSALYITREVEKTCYQELLKAGAFIHIKSPKKLGKTSLLIRLLAHQNFSKYYIVRLSLLSAETQIFISTSKFLRWFCCNVTQQLGLESKIDEYWDEDMGAIVSCTIYFQWYILRKISAPIILAIDEINQLFSYPDIAKDFFSLLCLWHEKITEIEIWKHIRIIIVYSTTYYGDLPVNKNYFDISHIGLIVELSPFNKAEMQELIKLYNIKFTENQLEKLVDITGGLPYLVRLILDNILHSHITLEHILEYAATNTAIFYTYFQEYCWYLKQSPELCTAFKKLIYANSPIALETEIAFKLKNLGLVTLDRNNASVSCGLYRDYFRDYFSLLEVV